MPVTETRLGLAAFALLALGTAANLLLFQERRPGATVETSAISGGSKRSQAHRLDGPQTAAPVEQAANDGAPQAAAPLQQKSVALAPPADTTVNKAEIIRGVQRELNTRGYGTGQPDGVAGLLTRASIMAYEYDYGLSLTAEPTQELLSRIVLGTAGPAASLKNQPQIKSGEAEGVVKVVKQLLAGLGYGAGKADGKLGDETIRAIRDFELDQKLPETGRISGQLVSRLLRVQGQGKPAAGAGAKG